MRDLVLNKDSEERITVEQLKFIRNKNKWTIQTITVTKHYRQVYDKLILFSTSETLPFGFLIFFLYVIKINIWPRRKKNGSPFKLNYEKLFGFNKPIGFYHQLKSKPQKKDPPMEAHSMVRTFYTFFEKLALKVLPPNISNVGNFLNWLCSALN